MPIKHMFQPLMNLEIHVRVATDSQKKHQKSLEPTIFSTKPDANWVLVWAAFLVEEGTWLAGTLRLDRCAVGVVFFFGNRPQFLVNEDRTMSRYVKSLVVMGWI